MFRKWLTWPLALLCALASAQTYTPTSRPHQNFVDNSGNPCALCTLGTFAAGTTTPLATYSDASGTPNQNPINLDVAGGANIWVDPTLAYKYVLKDSLGNTIWTVDNVKSSGGGAVPCTTPFAIQYANSDHTALACDPTITIDPTSHSVLVGGAPTGPLFTLTALGTITDSWTFDITSPTTALNSFGPIPLSNLAAQNPGTIVMNDATTSQVPIAFPLPSGCTTGLNWNDTTRIWSCVGTNIPLSNLAAQPPDTVTGNFTGSTASPTATPMPTGCANGVNYSTVTHAWTCAAISSWTCTGAGCYRQATDGTYEEFGSIIVPPSGTSFNSATITFPQSFVGTPVVTITTVGQASSTGDPNSPPCSALQTLSNTNATAFMMRCIVASAGGGNFDNTLTLNWHAYGK